MADQWEEYDAEDEPEEVDPWDECGQDGDGVCRLAGTEHCDFECPFRDELRF